MTDIIPRLSQYFTCLLSAVHIDIGYARAIMLGNIHFLWLSRLVPLHLEMHF